MPSSAPQELQSHLADAAHAEWLETQPKQWLLALDRTQPAVLAQRPTGTVLEHSLAVMQMALAPEGQAPGRRLVDTAVETDATGWMAAVWDVLPPFLRGEAIEEALIQMHPPVPAWRPPLRMSGVLAGLVTPEEVAGCARELLEDGHMCLESDGDPIGALAAARLLDVWSAALPRACLDGLMAVAVETDRQYWMPLLTTRLKGEEVAGRLNGGRETRTGSRRRA